jgi:enoyl-CoA hydratase/carnithine racemase
MRQIEDYKDRYKNIAFERSEDGVLEVRLHSDDGPWKYDYSSHPQLYEAFWEIANDPKNRVVIITGTGDEFSGPKVKDKLSFPRPQWDEAFYEGRLLFTNLLNIDAPMIAAINGPAYRHSEIPLLCDITIASETATFSDSGHFEHGGLVPGDGIGTVMQMLLGPNRGRYYLLMDQTLTAADALKYGVVNEVLAPSEVLPRAREIAHHFAEKPDLLLRYTRRALVEPIKDLMNKWAGFGLAIEGLAGIKDTGATS